MGTAEAKPLVVGHSGVIFSDGTLRQLRAKRSIEANSHNFGPSGAVLADGQQVQFTAEAKPVVVGHSGVIFSDGTLRQLRAERSIEANSHNFGPSGAVLADGQQVQFT